MAGDKQPCPVLASFSESPDSATTQPRDLMLCLFFVLFFSFFQHMCSLQGGRSKRDLLGSAGIALLSLESSVQISHDFLLWCGGRRTKRNPCPHQEESAQRDTQGPSKKELGLHGMLPVLSADATPAGP